MEDNKIKFYENLFDRAEQDTIKSVEVEDGRVFVFTKQVLERLLIDVEKSEHKEVVVFIRKKPLEVA